MLPIKRIYSCKGWLMVSGVIQGDGVDYESVPKILGALKDAGRPCQEGEFDVAQYKNVWDWLIVLVHLSSNSGHGGFSNKVRRARCWQGKGVSWRFLSIWNVPLRLDWSRNEHAMLPLGLWAGFAADNMVFGSGGALLQKLNRDTFKCAFKCSEITVNGQAREVFKERRERWWLMWDDVSQKWNDWKWLEGTEVTDFFCLRQLPNTWICHVFCHVFSPIRCFHVAACRAWTLRTPSPTKARHPRRVAWRCREQRKRKAEKRPGRCQERQTRWIYIQIITRIIK